MKLSIAGVSAAVMLGFGAPSSAATIYGILAGNYVETFDGQSLLANGYISTPSASGLTVGSGGIYVSSGTSLTRYNASGAVLASTTLPGGYTIGSLANYGNTVYGALAGNYVESFQSQSLLAYNFISTPSVMGVAAGANGIYVSSGTNISLYTTGGALEASQTLPAGYTIGSLSLYHGTVYGILAGNYIESFDATSLTPFAFISAPSAAGVAVDGDGIYVSSGTTISRYSFSGVLEASATLPPGYTIGSLAIGPSSVPEPATWVFMMAGLGLVAATMRRRRTSARIAA